MKIVGLDVANVMRIRAVHIEPSGNVVILGGRNAQGKTSTLDAISMAIGGKRLCPAKPIRDGEDEAAIEVDLGELTVTRTFRRAGDTYSSELKVRNASGEPLSRPQSVLDDLVGALAFDPLEFAHMPPADRAATLRELVGLDVAELEAEQERVYAKRTEAGQEKRAAQAVVDDLAFYPDEGTELRSVQALADELGHIAAKQREMDALRARADRCRDRVGIALDAHTQKQRALQIAKAAVVEAEQALAESVLHVEETTADAEAAEAVSAAFELPSDVEPRAKLADIEEFNRKVRANLTRAEKQAEADETEAEWRRLEERHNELVHEIKRRTEAVSYPIPGLELRKEGVYYQGQPFEQASRAERIKVSLAMGCALNKGLRVCLIRDGSVLDEQSMALIAEMAHERDFQFWIEMARGFEGAPEAVIIEDGARAPARGDSH